MIEDHMADAIITQARGRFAGTERHPGDDQLIVMAALIDRQDALNGVITSLVEKVSACPVMLPRNGTKARIQQVAPPALGLGGLAAILAWFMERFS